MTAEDIELLDAYTATKSDEAFGVLVERYAGMVYHAALRQVGNPHTAEEITQEVFITLAWRAPRISRRALLSGWLFRVTRYAVLNHYRSEARRQRREKESFAMQSTHEPHEIDNIWEQISPQINHAMESLPTRDREALLIRFFEGRSHKDVAKALGLSEDAAKMRVGRAVEKLRHLFVKRGIGASSVGLVAALFFPFFLLFFSFPPPPTPPPPPPHRRN
jgi:RNA polymerase sigma factor (sigma-70 family)